MQAGSTFHELAYALPEEERRELYRRIMASLGLSREQERRETIVPTSIHDQQRRSMIEREITELGLWAGLRLWLRSWMTGKAKEDAFVDIKLLKLRKKLVRRGVCRKPTSTELLCEDFAVRLFALFQAAEPVATLFADIWQSREMLRDVLQALLERKIPGARTSLNDFLTDEQIQEVYLANYSKTDIRNQLLERLDSYIARIHDGVFAEIAAGIMPLHYMKSLALFDYVHLLALFGYTAGERPPEEAPRMSDARASDALDQLEELYYAFYTWQRMEGKIRIHRELLELYLQAKHVSHSDVPLGADETGQQVELLEQDIRALNSAAALFVKQNPLADMIRYYHADPYFRFVVYVPRINLKDFYYSALRIMLLEQIDHRFGDIREAAINKMIEETFGHQPPDFAHFRSGSAASVSKLGLPTFRHVRSLNILYNYVQIIYRRVIRQRLVLIHRAIAARNRDLSNELSYHAAGLEDIADKIAAFEESFSPESEEGKSFYRIRYAMEKDVTQQRIYRSVVTQRERQSRTLLDKGLEYLQGMQTVLTRLRTLQDGLKDDDAERAASVQTLIERYSSSLLRVIRLVRLMVSAEENPA